MKLIDFLIHLEGLKLKVYDDKTGKEIGPGSVLKGHPTIAIGRCLDTRGITREEAIYLCHNDIAKFDHDLEMAFRWYGKLSDVRRAVVFAMAFQLGMGGLAGFKQMIAAIIAGDFDRAADCMLDSDWARTQTPERAHELAQMMREDRYLHEAG